MQQYCPSLLGWLCPGLARVLDELLTRLLNKLRDVGAMALSWILTDWLREIQVARRFVNPGRLVWKNCLFARMASFIDQVLAAKINLLNLLQGGRFNGQCLNVLVGFL